MILLDKENEILKEQKFLIHAKFNAKKLERFYRLKLHQITQMSAKEARQLLIEDTKKECAEELKDIRREQLGKAEASINREATNFISNDATIIEPSDDGCCYDFG